MQVKTSTEYVADSGAHCPVCGSENLEGQALEITRDGASHDIMCLACGSSWVDLYTLSRYDYLSINGEGGPEQDS
jgi:hypothetical protein